MYILLLGPFHQGFNLQFVFTAWTASEGTWNLLLTKQVAEPDGEISIEIGKFAVGTTLNFIFGIQAITGISSVMIFIVNGSSRTPVRMVPSPQPKALKAGET
jgi:hypothetical protein